jgi:Flp pilus assembly protein TadG
MKRLRDESGHASVIPALCMPSLFGSVPLAPPGVREQGMAQRATGRAVVAGASGPIFDRWLQRLLRNQGQALIEYILVIPLVFVLAVNMVNFGAFFYAFVTVANAARAGADYAILGGASVASGHTAAASPSQITTLITTDIASLPNNPSLSVNICQNNNGTVTVLSGTCSSMASDPEAANYVLTSIDVTYTYQPLIPLFSFPNLHIRATLPTTTIHRRAVMRSIQ